MAADDDVNAEVARLRGERDAAVTALEQERRAARRQHGVRRVAVGLLVVLFALLVPITTAASWAHRTVLNTDSYVSTITPIASDPAVIEAVSREVTNQLYVALDPQAVIADSLPPRAAFLAGPIANGAKGSVQQAVDRVLSSAQFQQLWVAANERAHATLVTVLRGDSQVLQTTDGQVVLNLVPLLNQALANSSDFVSGVVGKPVQLPTIGANELPSVACAKIATSLGRPLPSTCGQIALFPEAKLVRAQQAVQTFDRAVVALLIITPLVFALALFVSRRRRRTLLQLTLGAVLGLVVLRRALMWEQGQLIDAARPGNAAARTAIVETVLNGLFDLSLWLIVAGLVIAAVALLTGPYAWAVRIRRRTAFLGRRTGQLVSAGVRGSASGADDAASVAWVRQHFDVLRVTGVAVAILLFLVFSVSFWGFLLIAGLLALYELGLSRLRTPETITLPPDSDRQDSAVLTGSEQP